MIHCSNCGHSNRDGVRFCENCGSQLETPCPSCGTMGPPQRKFCGHCGHRLTQGTSGESGKRGGERRHITVLFCDLVGSTPLSQRLDAEDLRNVMRGYADAARAVINRFGGHVARYMGDGVLCYFGYPQSFEDNAERSIRAGLEVVSTISKMRTPDGEPLQTRVGIASGRVVTGESAQSDSGFETLAIGDTPNLAARIQACAEPDTVVVAHATRQLVRGAFQWVDLGDHTLKGFSDPKRLWRVEPHKASAGSWDNSVAGEIIGREDELELLLKRWRRAQAAEMVVAHVVGEPGIGKSRLIKAFRDNIAREEAQEIVTGCAALGSASALYPMTSYVDRLLNGASKELEPIELLEQRIRKVTTTDRVSLQCLAHMLGMRFKQASAIDDLSPRQQQNQALALLKRWLLALSEERSLVMIIEDVHWIDPTSLEWLRDIAQQDQSARLMLILTSRPDSPHALDLGANTLTLSLAHLDRQGSERVMGNIAGGRALPPEVVDIVTTKADGVPLFIEEITRTLMETGVLEFRDGDCVIHGSLEQLGVPDSLQDSLMARLDREPWIRDIAQTAAIIGREFTLNLLADVIGRDEKTVEAALDQLAEIGLLRRRGGMQQPRWEFKHALVCEAAYESSLRTQRTVTHGLVAEAIHRQHPEYSTDRPEVLAHHYSQAGRFDEAVTMWQRAGERARSAWANREAVSHFERALADYGRIEDADKRPERELELRLALGDALRVAKGTSAMETNTAYRLAAEIADTVDDMAALTRARYGEFVTHFNAARLDSALGPAQVLLTMGERRDDLHCLVAGHQALGMHAFATGAFDAAREHFENALSRRNHEDLKDIDIQFPGLSQSYLSWTLHLMGEADAALQVSHESIEDARGESSYSLALTLSNACYLHQFRNDVMRVSKLATELEEIALARDLPAWQSVATFFKRWCTCQAHPSDDHLDALEDALSLWDEDEIETPYFKCIVGETLIRGGQHERGLVRLNEAADLMGATGETWYRPKLKLLRDQLGV